MSKTKTDATLTPTEKILGVLSYISFFCILGLVLKRESKFVQLHAKQGLIFTVFFYIAQALLGSLIPGFAGLLGFLQVLVVIIGITFAVQGKLFRFPAVADMADKLDLSS